LIGSSLPPEVKDIENLDLLLVVRNPFGDVFEFTPSPTENVLNFVFQFRLEISSEVRAY